MSVRKADDFIADVERQFDWYLVKAGWEVADRYLDAVEATCRLLGQHPNLGPRGGFTHPRLHEWRFFLVSPPFNQHILFYELAGGWLQWQFNLRKVEFAGVSAYFYGHGHHAAELKTRSV